MLMYVTKAKISSVGSAGCRIVVGGRVTAELPAVKGCFTQSNPAEPGMDVVVALSESYASGVILGVL